MSQPDPRTLLVLSFDSLLKSREAFLAFQRLQAEQVLVLHDAVFVDHDEDGRAIVTETTDPTPSSSAVGGGLWGALFGTLIAGPLGTALGAAAGAGLGALSAKLVDIGIPDETVRELRDALPPSSAALAVLVSHLNEAGLEKELARFAGATLVRSSLTPEIVQRLRNVLAPPAAAP
jgi:uncharacterized membrane protein